MMALRSRSAGTGEIELSAPARRFSRRPIAADHGAHLHRGALAEVDAAERVLRTLELADAKARRGPYCFASKRFDAVDNVAGSLPAARQAQREAWAQRRVCVGR